MLRLLDGDAAKPAGVEVVVVFVDASGGESERNRGPGGDIAEIERRVIGVGGMGSGINRGVGATIIDPGDGGTGLDGNFGWFKARGSNLDSILIHGLDSGLAVGSGALFGKIEIVDGVVDQSSDDEINEDPLP